MAKTFKTAQSLINTGFNQISGQTLSLSGCTIIGDSATFKYATNQHSKYTARSVVDASYVTGQTAIINHIGSNQQIIYRDINGITGATHLIYNKSLPSLNFGSNNCAEAIDSAIIGGNNNYISSGNTGSTIFGGNNIILSGITYCNTVVVPNLAIWFTPEGSGNILAWDSLSKKVCLVSGGTGGGGTWGSITGVLSGQTDLQNALNDKLNITAFNDFTGTTAPLTYLGINACAADSAKLGDQLPAYYLNTGSTAICATCAVGAKNLCGYVPASFLLSGGTAICATCAVDSKGLCGCVPSCFLGTTACANDSAKLGGQLPAYYLSSGGTAACACDSAKLGGILPAGYMLTGATYNLTSPSIFATGGMCAGTILTGKTAFEIIKEILAPELCGVLTAPSEAIAANPTGIFEIGCTISTLCITATFSRGCINPQYCSTSSFRSGLANSYVFTGCQIAGSYACTTSPVTKCAIGYVICANQTWAVCTCYDCGIQPKGNAGSNFSSPLVAGVSNIAGVTLTGIYPYYYGKLSNGSRPAVTNSLITGGTKVVANSVGTVIITFGSSDTEYTWFGIPATSTSKICWYRTALDNAYMNRGCATDKYPDECTIAITSGQGCWSTVNYKVYMSLGAGAIATAMEFRNS